MIEFPFGQSVRLRAAFEDDDGAADPSTVTFSYGLALVNPPPSPTAVSLVYLTDGEVIRDSAGRYHADLTGLASGNYIAEAVGTGDVAAVTPRAQFRVLPSPFA